MDSAPYPFVAARCLTVNDLPGATKGTAMELDRVIVETYVRFDTPADQIVADPDLAGQFGDAVNGRLPREDQVDLATLNKRLLNLRRRGEEKGGLPRLRRDYNGRGPKPR